MLQEQPRTSASRPVLTGQRCAHVGVLSSGLSCSCHRLPALAACRPAPACLTQLWSGTRLYAPGTLRAPQLGGSRGPAAPCQSSRQARQEACLHGPSSAPGCCKPARPQQRKQRLQRVGARSEATRRRPGCARAPGCARCACPARRPAAASWQSAAARRCTCSPGGCPLSTAGAQHWPPTQVCEPH